MRRFSVLRFLILATTIGAAACANDPFAARRETPRLGAVGWIVADPVADVETRAPEYADGVRATAQALDAHVDLACVAPRSVVIVGAETLPASDTALLELEQGPIVTRERVAVTACGRTRLHTIYPAHHPQDMPGDMVVFLTGVPGASIASLGLQRDVVAQIVSQAAGIVAASLDEGVCDATENEPWVLDTELTVPPQEGVWEEAWTLQACGIQRSIQVRFEETATGVRFSSPITLEES